jgi:hypothetical protein
MKAYRDGINSCEQGTTSVAEGWHGSAMNRADFRLCRARLDQAINYLRTGCANRQDVQASEREIGMLSRTSVHDAAVLVLQIPTLQ